MTTPHPDLRAEFKEKFEQASIARMFSDTDEQADTVGDDFFLWIMERYEPRKEVMPDALGKIREG